MSRPTASRGAARNDGESGQVTLFGIGLVLMILIVGGVSLDLWRVVASHHSLTQRADSAAAAGADVVDVDHYRQTGEVLVDPAGAERAALWSLAFDGPVEIDSAAVRAEPGRVTVVVSGRVDFVLLSLIAPGEGVELEVESRAEPRRSAG